MRLLGAMPHPIARVSSVEPIGNQVIHARSVNSFDDALKLLERFGGLCVSERKYITGGYCDNEFALHLVR